MTKEQSPYKKYTELLRDEKFLQWRIFPDAETNAFWEALQQNCYGLKDEIALADRYLKKHMFGKNTFSLANKQMLLDEIKQSLTRHKKRHAIRLRLKYAAAVACIALIVSIPFLFRQNVHTEHPSQDIVGNLLDSKDIQLITHGESKSFKENISVKIDARGRMEVREDNRQKTDMHIAQNAMNKLIVPHGKRSSIELSDGSRLWLNSGSVLEFPAQFSGNNREIHLASGEMYIEVAPNKKKPFYVQTSEFNVRVYGTKFNISTYSGTSQSVVLVEGSVALRSDGNKETFLLPNQRAVYSQNGTFDTRNVDVNQFISWKDGYLEFDDTPMEDVLKQIERYYNLSFNYDKDVSLKGYTCTGKVILFDNLDNVMTTLALMSQTKYRKEGKQIYITINPAKKTSVPMEK